jgi:hypothetical protein
MLKRLEMKENRVLKNVWLFKQKSVRKKLQSFTPINENELAPAPFLP